MYIYIYIIYIYIYIYIYREREREYDNYVILLLTADTNKSFYDLDFLVILEERFEWSVR